MMVVRSCDWVWSMGFSDGMLYVCAHLHVHVGGCVHSVC